MKREADAAELVVANHHLFFADIALRGPHPARVLPDYEAAIFDEAHQLEDVATEFFSVRVSSARVERLKQDLERALRAIDSGDPLFSQASSGALAEAAEVAADRFFRALRLRAGNNEDGRVALERDVFSGELLRLYHQLDNALEGVAALCSATSTRVSEAPARRGTRATLEALRQCERRADQLREQLATIVDAGRGRVVWLEVVARRLVLSSTPVDLSVLLRERVFEQIPAAILTSATLATANPKPTSPSSEKSEKSEKPEKSPFAYVRTRLGLDSELDRVDELIVPSPFDFSKQAIFYAPRDLPSPGGEAFWEASSERIAELIALTAGGCFVLTTSLRSMRELHARLRRKVGALPLLIQGDAPKAALVARFRAAGNAVLVATSGFWEGVDVPGNALRLVVLEKIPFAVPTDPIVNARSLSLEAAGENAFMKLHVPSAAIALKQGFGRLVRTQRDFGIVALLDERIHRKGYGKKLLGALPPAAQTSDLAAVQRFWLERKVS
jgi:ATP-dependent DNA helicase DinG